MCITELEKAMLKFINTKRPSIAKAMLSKKSNAAYITISDLSQMWWSMPLFPAFCEFQASKGYIRPILNTHTKKLISDLTTET